MMTTEPIQEVISNALKKRDVLQTSKLQYFLRAALAGIYIGFGIMISYRLAEYFFHVKSPVTSLMSSIFFGIALILIIYGEAELFTGNTMTFTISTLKKATTWKDTMENWIYCYIGNLAGAVFFALIIMLTGLFSSPEKSQYLMEVVNLKMNTPALQLFFRAILANWLVCLAVFLPMHVKGDGSKIAIMMLLVFAFVVSGFEHSVANLVLFATSLVVPHPDTITVAGAIHNLIPVTIGNIIGGGLFVGALYVYLGTKPAKKAAYAESVQGKKVFEEKALTRI